MIKKKKVYT